MRYARILKIALTLLLTSTPAYGAEHQLKKDTSKVNFQLEGQTLSTRGAFDSYSGALVTDPKTKLPKQLSFVIDITKVTIDAEDPRTKLLIQQLISSLPTARVSFKSTEIRKQGEQRYLVVGEAASQAGKEVVTVPVEVVAENPMTWRIRGSLKGDDVFNGPEALLLGRNSGRVQFDLRFS